MTTKPSIEIPLPEFAGRSKNKIITILLKACTNLAKLTLTSFFKLFDAQVKPTVLYASEIWGLASDGTLNTIEKLQMFACKKVTGNNTSKTQCLGAGRTKQAPYNYLCQN